MGSLAVFSVLASGCSSSEPRSSAAGAVSDNAFADLEPMELTFNHTSPASGYFVEPTAAFPDYVTEATGGKVTFESFYSGSLLTAPETVTDVGDGVAGISSVSPILWAKDLADLQGRVVRVSSEQATAEVEALGMVPASLPFADVYEGLQRGVIDCAYSNGGCSTFKPLGLPEVAKYYVPVNGWVPTSGVGCGNQLGSLELVLPDEKASVAWQSMPTASTSSKTPDESGYSHA